MAHEIGITMEPVQSSNIKSRGYSEGQRILGVEFSSGALWQFSGVPLGTWERWLEASSAGSFFVHHIKGKFPGRKLTGDCPKCGSKEGPLGTKCTDCGTADYAPKEARTNGNS